MVKLTTLHSPLPCILPQTLLESVGEVEVVVAHPKGKTDTVSIAILQDM